jgi:hypothetical protein
MGLSTLSITASTRNCDPRLLATRVINSTTSSSSGGAASGGGGNGSKGGRKVGNRGNSDDGDQHKREQGMHCMRCWTATTPGDKSSMCEMRIAAASRSSSAGGRSHLSTSKKLMPNRRAISAVLRAPPRAQPSHTPRNGV